MNDIEIYSLCSTKEGCIKYLEKKIKENKGYYNWAYLPSEKVPLLLDLLKEGIIEHRINPYTKVEEWKLK